MNQVKSRAFKTAVFVCLSHVLFLYQKFSPSKIFVSLIFVVGWTKDSILTRNFSQFTVTMVLSVVTRDDPSAHTMSDKKPGQWHLNEATGLCVNFYQNKACLEDAHHGVFK